MRLSSVVLAAALSSMASATVTLCGDYYGDMAVPTGQDVFLACAVRTSTPHPSHHPFSRATFVHSTFFLRFTHVGSFFPPRPCRSHTRGRVSPHMLTL